MRLLEIERHLRSNLPRLLQDFSEQAQVQLSFEGSQGTATFSDAHSFQAGQYILLKNVQYTLPATANHVDGLIQLFTQGEHDITETEASQFVTLVNSSNPAFNASFRVMRAPSRNELLLLGGSAYPTTSFTCDLQQSAVSVYNSIYQITSVVNDTETDTYTVSFTVTQGRLTFDTTGDLVSLNGGVRVITVFSQEHAEKIIEAKGSDKAWVFLSPGAVVVSRTYEGNSTDHIACFSFGDDYRQVFEDNVAVVVAIPATSTVSPAAIMDRCRVDIRNALIKSLVRYPTQPTLKAGPGVVYLKSCSPYKYTKSHYYHAYEFGVTETITHPDAYTPPSVPIRAIDLFTTGHFVDQPANTEYPLSHDHLDFFIEEEGD